MTTKPWIIDPTNPSMCKWAYKYLRNRYDMPPSVISENDYYECTRLLNTLGSDRHDLLLRDMQTAWRQKQHREKQKLQGKTPCSFILSNGAIRELGRLSKSLDASINETLERIIHQTYIDDKERKKQRRQKSPFHISPQ